MRPGESALLNADFELQDYGTTALSATGWAFTRWRFEKTGSGVTCGPGVSDSNSNLEKWARSRACAELIVVASSYNPADTTLLRQRAPLVDRFGKQEALLRVVAFGPDGGSFDIALSGSLTQRRWRRVTTEGSTPGGTPRFVTGRLREDITELSQTYLTCEAFTNPKDMDATYRIVHTQLDFLRAGEPDPPLVYSPPTNERRRCAPYLWPCPRGHQALTLAGGTQIYVPISTPVLMNAAPTVVAGAAPATWKQGSTGTNFDSAAPTFTGSTTHTRGGRIIIGGYSALPAAASMGQIDSDRAFLLESELG